jgi:hypothetical protein
MTPSADAGYIGSDSLGSGLSDQPGCGQTDRMTDAAVGVLEELAALRVEIEAWRAGAGPQAGDGPH